MNIKKIILIIIVILPAIKTFAQISEIGAIGATNINLVLLTSKYDIQNKSTYKPIPGFNTGVYGIYKISDKYSICTSLEYQRTQNNESPGFVYMIYDGSTYFEYKKEIISHRALVNTMGIMKLNEKLYVGLGFSGNIMLSSYAKLKDVNFNGAQTDKFKNLHHRYVTLGLPIEFGLTKNKFDFFLRCNVGLNSKIKRSDFVVKERDNTLYLGMKYKIWTF